jgi:hypothetical protein
MDWRIFSILNSNSQPQFQTSVQFQHPSAPVVGLGKRQFFPQNKDFNNFGVKLLCDFWLTIVKATLTRLKIKT